MAEPVHAARDDYGITKGKPSVLGIISGAVAGLVAITPASGFVDPRGALIIGIAAGIVCYWSTTGLKHAMGYDDSLDAFGVRSGAVNGIVSTARQTLSRMVTS